MANKDSLKTSGKNDKKKKSVIKKSFIAGLLVILPVWLTILIIWYVFKWISSLSMPILSPFLNIFTSDSQWIDILAKIASFFLTLIIIFFVGFFTNIWFGKKLYNFFENILTKIPLIGSIYSALKKLFSFFATSEDTTNNFQKVIFVPFPTKDSYCVAFSTGEKIINGQKYISSFMPSTPNPTTGFLMLVKAEDVIESEYTIEEAIQFIISAGIVQPNLKQKNGQKQLGEKNDSI
ncbi:MAG: DUF502 domain-containing protein [Elusimicrobia bacterium]|nr:DUF502 domain-containing protein [Elusimicrobiota bacterium]